MSLLNWAFALTIENQRRIKTAIWIGIVVGLVSAIVKWGCGIPFPPFTPDRVAPPVAMMEWFGFKGPMYVFSGRNVPYGPVIHVGFSIMFGLFYSVVAEIFPRIKLWQGVAYGLGIYVVFHGFLVPLCGLTPWPNAMPGEEIFSEVYSHILTYWVMELMRHDLMRRVTGRPDPALKV